AALDKIDGPVDVLGRHVAADVLGRAQSHDLPARHADVGAVARRDVVTPTAALVFAPGALRFEDNSDRFYQLLADFVAQLGVGHARGLGEHERGNAVMVHYLTDVGGDKSVFVLSLEH